MVVGDFVREVAVDIAVLVIDAPFSMHPLTLATVELNAMGGAIIGAFVGTAQWLVLRRQRSRPGLWLLASIVGFALGFATGTALFTVAAMVIASLVNFAVVGIAQWLVLWRWQVNRPGWWVLATAVGFAVPFAVAFDVIENDSLAFAFIGAVGAAITGALLSWLLREPHSGQPSHSQNAA
jgi:hypothetical protein